MDESIMCPMCGHQRKNTDKNPKWQCPGCGVAYNKVKYSLVFMPEKNLSIDKIPDKITKSYIFTESSLYLFTKEKEPYFNKIEIEKGELFFLKNSLGVEDIYAEVELKILYENLDFHNLMLIKKILENYPPEPFQNFV